MDYETNTTNDQANVADAPVNTSVAAPSSAPALQNDAPGTVETPPAPHAVTPEQQPDPIQQDVVNIVKIGDADLASIVSAITPVIAAEFERILPALQAQGAQTARDVQAGVVSVIENQHMSLLSRIEGLLHLAQ
jgi:hypothetical protein